MVHKTIKTIKAFKTFKTIKTVKTVKYGQIRSKITNNIEYKNGAAAQPLLFVRIFLFSVIQAEPPGIKFRMEEQPRHLGRNLQ